MKKLLIILAVIIIAVVSVSCQPKEDKFREQQERRILQMDYITKLYQFNQTFAKNKKYWEVEKTIDSMIVVEEKLILEKENGKN